MNQKHWLQLAAYNAGRYKTIRSSQPSHIGKVIKYLSDTGPKRGKVVNIKPDHNTLDKFKASNKLLTVDTFIIY